MSQAPSAQPSTNPPSLLSDDDKRFIVRALAAQAFAMRKGFAGLSLDEAVGIIELWISRASDKTTAAAPTSGNS